MIFNLNKESIALIVVFLAITIPILNIWKDSYLINSNPNYTVARIDSFERFYLGYQCEYSFEVNEIEYHGYFRTMMNLIDKYKQNGSDSGLIVVCYELTNPGNNYPILDSLVTNRPPLDRD
jgi:hypothetical protein